MTIAKKLDVGRQEGKKKAVLAAAAVVRTVLVPLAGCRPRTTLSDVVSIDRKHSLTGLYSLDKGILNPRKEGPLSKRETILVRTKGLSAEQKADLKEQNIGIVFVRESSVAPNILGVISSEAASREPDNIFGTKVVPYLSVSAEQAAVVTDTASKMPLPRDENKPRQRVESSQDMIACFAPFGGC